MTACPTPPKPAPASLIRTSRAPTAPDPRPASRAGRARRSQGRLGERECRTVEPEATRARERPRRRRLWARVLAGLVLLVVLVAGWLGWRGYQVWQALAPVETTLSGLRSTLADGDTQALVAATAGLPEAAARASAATSDPVWRAAEHVPWLGTQLRAVSAVTEALGRGGHGRRARADGRRRLPRSRDARALRRQDRRRGARGRGPWGAHRRRRRGAGPRPARRGRPGSAGGPARGRCGAGPGRARRGRGLARLGGPGARRSPPGCSAPTVRGTTSCWW